LRAMKFAIILFILMIGLLVGTCYSPTLSIRRHLFLVNPIQSITCNISKTNYYDNRFGQQYIINGFIDPGSKTDITFAYVKSNFLGWNYWVNGGSGP
jgi:hypothetical protein